MSTAYDTELRALASHVAEQLDMSSYVSEGVYFYQAGPCYETIAESRMARCLGADVIGASFCVRRRHLRIKWMTDVPPPAWCVCLAASISVCHAAAPCKIG